MTPATGSAARTAIPRHVLRETGVNLAMAVPAIRRLRLRRPRNSSGFDGSPDLLEHYAFQALRGLERLVGPVRGRSIVEFGPGDHLAAGLAMLAAGASRYMALDRFIPDYASPAAKHWYEGVQAGWSTAFPEHPWPADLRATSFPESYPHLVTTIAGGVEGEAARCAGGAYDIVTSWQVGEHVSDIRAFADLTRVLLAPGGVAVHCVDFGPHDCWLRYSDPLTFLRFPSPLWRAMSSHRGSPNRRRHHEFLATLQAVGLTVACHDQIHLDLDEVDISRLDPRFQNMPRDSLAMRGITYVCRLPAQSEA